MNKLKGTPVHIIFHIRCENRVQDIICIVTRKLLIKKRHVKFREFDQSKVCMADYHLSTKKLSKNYQ